MEHKLTDSDKASFQGRPEDSFGLCFGPNRRFSTHFGPNLMFLDRNGTLVSQDLDLTGTLDTSSEAALDVTIRNQTQN